MAITCKTGDRIEERVPRCPSGRAVQVAQPLEGFLGVPMPQQMLDAPARMEFAV